MAKITYTYSNFASDVIALADGILEMTPDLAEKMRAKASDLLATQATKAAYNAAHPSKSKAKGASDVTKTLAKDIEDVLTSVPMTGAEIAHALGKELNALQISNAVQYIPNAKKTLVIRSVTNSKGLRAEKQYAAYYIG